MGSWHWWLTAVAGGFFGRAIYEWLKAARRRGQDRLGWTLGFADVNSWSKGKKIKVALAVLVLEPGLFFRAAWATLRSSK